MKRTELEKRERKMKSTLKKQDVLERKMENNRQNSVNDYINDLFALFRYDTKEIFNAKEDIQIIEFFEEMKENVPDKQWENVIKKAIKRTNIEEKDRAYNELKTLFDQV